MFPEIPRGGQAAEREQPREEENRGTEVLPGEQSSKGCTRGAPLARAVEALNRDSSTEQRPTEQSWSTGKRQPEHSSSSGYRARKPGSSRPEDAGAGREQGPGSLQPQQSHDQQQDPFLQWKSAVGNAKCWLGERGGFTACCHLLSHLPDILGGKLSSALCQGL